MPFFVRKTTKALHNDFHIYFKSIQHHNIFKREGTHQYALSMNTCSTVHHKNRICHKRLILFFNNFVSYMLIAR